MPLTAVTFDVTGTLIHCPRMPEVYAEVLGRHGIEVEPEDMAREFRNAWSELDCSTPSGADRFSSHEGGSRGYWQRLLERICELIGVERPSRFAAAELYSRFALGDAWEVYDEVPAVLEELDSAGMQMGVISNWDERLPGLLRDLDLERYFDVVVYSQALEVAKPDGGIFLRALDRLGAGPEESLHVGDSVREDFEGAVAVGMEALLLERRRDGASAPDLRAVLELVAPVGRP